MKTKPPSNWKVQLAFGAAILTLLVVGTISYRGLIESSESDRWVRHTHDVLESLEGLRSAVSGVESSSRGFALTGKESYVESCRASVAAARQYMAAIGQLTLDNQLQQSRLPELERLAAAKLQFADTVIDIRRSRGLAAAEADIDGGQGLHLMDEFQMQVRNMQDEEGRLMAQRIAEAERRLRQTKSVMILGTLLGLLFAGGAGWSAQRDHAGRALAEQAVREGDERFRDMANNISQLAWMADENGSIFWYNDRWFDYTGTTLSEVVGWGGEKMLHPDHQQRVMDKIKQSFQLGEVWEDTFPLRGRDGAYRWFLSRAVPIRDADGKVLRWFGTNTDVAEIKTLEAELPFARAHAIESARKKAEFLANMSHEIRTPMNGIIGMTELVLDTELDREQREFLGMAKSSAHTLLGLLNDILDFSKIEAGKLALEAIDFSLRECIGSMLRPLGVR